MDDKEFEQMTPEEKKERFRKAVDNYNKGIVEEDGVIRTVASDLVEEAMNDAGLASQDFKPAQRKVIYEAAKADVDLDYFMNPKFSATHMRFILEQLKEGKDVKWLPVGKVHENIVYKPLSKEKIERIRERMKRAEARTSVIEDLRDKQAINGGIVSKKTEKKSERGER